MRLDLKELLITVDGGGPMFAIDSDHVSCFIGGRHVAKHDLETGDRLVAWVTDNSPIHRERTPDCLVQIKEVFKPEVEEVQTLSIELAALPAELAYSPEQEVAERLLEVMETGPVLRSKGDLFAELYDRPYRAAVASYEDTDRYQEMGRAMDLLHDEQRMRWVAHGLADPRHGKRTRSYLYGLDERVKGLLGL